MNNQHDDPLENVSKDKIPGADSNKIELLLPSQKILLAGPTFLGTIVAQMGSLPIGDHSLVIDLFDEWGNIYNAIVNLVGRENLIVMRNHVIVGDLKKGRYFPDITLDDVVTRKISLPSSMESSLGIVEFPWLQGEFVCWPRNALSNVGGHTLINNTAWNGNILANSFEAISDAGRIITAPNSRVVFVTSEVKRDFPLEVAYLRSLGLKVGELPLANKKGKKGRFPEEDIDGFVFMINHNGQDILYVAKSYFTQSIDKSDQKLIERSTKNTGVKLVVVDDKDLPHLSFNGIVFNNGSVLLASPSDGQLAKAIARDIGRENIFTIPPLSLTSLFTGGGLGCLTNTLDIGIIPISEG